MSENGKTEKETPRRSEGEKRSGTGGARPAGRKPAARADGKRPYNGRPGEKRAYGKKPDGKPDEKRSYSGKPDGGRPYGRRSDSRTGGPGKGPYGRPAPKKPVKTPTEPEGLPARRTALKVLRRVTEEGAYASLSLDDALQGSGLSGADRRLVSRLVYDTLENLIYLDYMLSQVMAREDTDIRLRNILRLGVCQLLLEDRIPESAAVNTSVQLCAEIGLEGLKGVCNGILRNVIRKKDELTLPDPETEPDRYFSVRYSVPEWLGTRLRADWGDEEAVRMVSGHDTDRGITIRRNLLRTDEAGFEKILEKKVWGREKTDLPGAWRVTGAMDIGRDADFLDGNFSIQSESSMMACLALSPRRGAQVLDCCAAPGGKTCYISEMMGDTGRVQAWDIHEHRVQLISAQQRRLGLENIRPIVRDAAKFREDLEGRMDAVLLDAPCSGLGVMAEKPDILLRVTEESVAELVDLQARLLETVSRYVREGGTLVYSTCSVLKDENERQVRRFLDAHPEFEAEELPESIPEKYRRHQALGLQLTEHRDGVEGFYICRMRRKESV